MRNMNTSIFVKDNDKKAIAYLGVKDKELTISVVAKGEQYDFVLSADDLRFIDFIMGKDKIEIGNSPSEFTTEIRLH